MGPKWLLRLTSDVFKIFLESSLLAANKEIKTMQLKESTLYIVFPFQMAKTQHFP